MPPPESFDSLPLEEAIKYEYTIDDEGVGSVFVLCSPFRRF